MKECFVDLEEIPTPILALPPPPTGAPEPPVDEGSISSEEGEFLDHRARRNTGATSNMNEAPTQVSCLVCDFLQTDFCHVIPQGGGSG